MKKEPEVDKAIVDPRALVRRVDGAIGQLGNSLHLFALCQPAAQRIWSNAERSKSALHTRRRATPRATILCRSGMPIAAR